MAPGNVPEPRWINEFGDAFPQRRERGLRSRMEEQRLPIAREEMFELYVELRNANGRSAEVRVDFMELAGGHVQSLPHNILKRSRTFHPDLGC